MSAGKFVLQNGITLWCLDSSPNKIGYYWGRPSVDSEARDVIRFRTRRQAERFQNIVGGEIKEVKQS